ncbi:hypothetical protein [Prochlorococcus sp. MIT 0916]|uniref:hypothetical protein n=1 Tax=Prochlorococcus sp. MIT 0916 TaxID=3082521 RepID=UPI0039B58B15
MLTRGVYLFKLSAKYFEELSGYQPVENEFLDPSFHIDGLTSVGTRIAQITDLLSTVDDREVVMIDEVYVYGKTIKAALEDLTYGAGL